ncbi:MAG: bifunctional demethylmenaquinone methyltransferase/2-methoxy-6-polyprenyl-1,4-benzoquinol methylase UbiE [Bacteroidales bacterium]|jgi:demethylmenaquinone methyltransferase/2-methoxy-6-polyprenyl-1,4-benzoquinol methylase
MNNREIISDADKKNQVGSMFDGIASSYDFLNHFLSFGIDRIWRRKAIQTISRFSENPAIIDVATGTGDLAIAAMKLRPLYIKGIDISEKMLEEGRDKIKRKGLSDKIELLTGDSEHILFGDGSFDVAMCAFGVRNFDDPVAGLREMGRVLKNGGLIMILEFSKPASFPFRQIYYFYFMKIVPMIGKAFSNDKKAYGYLPKSVMQFPENEEFIGLLAEAGFSDTKQKRLSGGIATIYMGRIFKTQ